MSMNLFVGIGNLTRDPEMRYTSTGTAYTKFTVAINSRRKDADPLFLDCTSWEKTAEMVAEYLRKGSKCCVTGEIRMDRWEGDDGVKRTKWFCNATNVQFLDRPPERKDSPPDERYEQTQMEYTEDELPF